MLKIIANLFYLLLIMSLAFSSISLAKIGSANIRLWQLFLFIYLILAYLFILSSSKAEKFNGLLFIFLIPCFLAVLISGFSSLNFDLWLKQSLLILLMFLLSVLVSNRLSKSYFQLNLAAVTYSGIFVSIWGILEIFISPSDLLLYYSDGLPFPRAQSFFAEPNEFSQYLSLPFGFLFSTFIYNMPTSKFERGVIYVGFIAVIIAQILSFSRGGLLVFLSQLFFWLVFNLRRFSLHAIHKSLLKSTLFIFIFIIIIFLLQGELFEYVFEIVTERISSLFSGGDVTSKIRWDGIILSLNAIFSSVLTFVIGLGFGCLTEILGDGIATTANFLVDIFVETGLIGALAFSTLIFYILFESTRIIKHFKYCKDKVILQIFWSSILSFIGLLVGGLTYATHMLPIFWFLVGLLFSIINYFKLGNYVK